jgi:hypothetical protein
MKTIDYKFDIKSQNVKVNIPSYSTVSFVKSINLEMNKDTLSHHIYHTCLLLVMMEKIMLLFQD